MSNISIIQGEIFNDERGRISSLNSFHFDEIKRTYIIYHPDQSVIRGWHAHKFERKWFYCIKGHFSVALVKPDNWEEPSHNLKAEIFHLTENDSKILCVPAGYANCLKAHEQDSIIQVFSDKVFEEALNDSWRFPKEMWVEWNNV